MVWQGLQRLVCFLESKSLQHVRCLLYQLRVDRDWLLTDLLWIDARLSFFFDNSAVLALLLFVFLLLLVLQDASLDVVDLIFAFLLKSRRREGNELL